MRNRLITIFLGCLGAIAGFSQALDFTAVSAEVDFSAALRKWDGFGFNYVETAHTSDMNEFKQEYGGFSLLDKQEQKEIIEMVFGEEGLKVGLVKMFLGSLHQTEAGGPYNHRHTSENMRYFVRKGLKTTRARGAVLQIITTLYGPPGYTTLQKVHRGRDLDPAYRDAVADYMVDWVRFLGEEEHFPVTYLSLHNEREDWKRWNQQGYTEDPGHDYNLFWLPERVTEFLKLMPAKLEAAGLADVGITPGETTSWSNMDAFNIKEMHGNIYTARVNGIIPWAGSVTTFFAKN